MGEERDGTLHEVPTNHLDAIKHEGPEPALGKQVLVSRRTKFELARSEQFLGVSRLEGQQWVEIAGMVEVIPVGPRQWTGRAGFERYNLHESRKDVAYHENWPVPSPAESLNLRLTLTQSQSHQLSTTGLTNYNNDPQPGTSKREDEDEALLRLEDLLDNARYRFLINQDISEDNYDTISHMITNPLTIVMAGLTILLDMQKPTNGYPRLCPEYQNPYDIHPSRTTPQSSYMQEHKRSNDYHRNFLVAQNEYQFLKTTISPCSYSIKGKELQLKGKERQYQNFEEDKTLNPEVPTATLRRSGLKYEVLMKKNPLKDFDTIGKLKHWAWSQGFALTVKSSKPNRNVYLKCS
ncbi:hypothetical protein PPACK8108_LOCUS24353 [Phakopsora pachyrhizi]|uniref:Uncharacterized protein n=1 Tax=Phakopsora pachyrhizi TaxID=170000 RepID=A0AAV0BS63_PHAPC|nr:hypothetical protein PPACK8108_LOCUS24353 [Phakopsora pachyrhizi]